MKRISVYVPRHAVIEAISPAYRLFKTANEFLQALGREPQFDVEFVGLDRQVPTNDGEYSVTVNRLLQDVTSTDLIVLPALYGKLDEALDANADALPWIKQMHERGAEVASLCIGAFLLGKSGLISGRSCSTHWAYYDEFRARFPDVHLVDGSVITDEGKIYSSGGASSLWNLLLYLLEKYTDREVAVLASKYFVIDINRQSQAAFSIFSGQKGHTDAEILRVQQQIERKYSDRLTIDDLAIDVNLSRRTFERRFKQATHNTVIEYIQRVRVEAAKRSFESSRKNVSEVMMDVGYTDTKAFRDVFKKITGLTPIEYRNKYRKPVMV